MSTFAMPELPGLDCGLCGYKTCHEFGERVETNHDLLKRCVMLSTDRVRADAAAASAASTAAANAATKRPGPTYAACCDVMTDAPPCHLMNARAAAENPWVDSLGRDFHFYLEHFPEEPGPREIILPHNPQITRELDVQVGDTLIGRPLGMSCGCPITHCGVCMDVDQRTGVMAWCVTGPLKPRQSGYKDLGYYIAEGYEGLVNDSREELRIGARYFFQPRMCMLQWRHSGLLNYLNKTGNQWQVRLEGLWIG